ncbi:MAG: hypothetical protein ABR986_05960 [Methanomassiliicoccales archaeon]|jgi:hypothetical protein
MRKGLTIAGGIVGAMFTGASVWAFTEKHMETVYYYGFPVQQQVNGYPDLGALFLVFAILGFVIMVVGLVSKPDGGRSIQPILQNPTYACPYCGQLFAHDTPVCPKCNREMKW